MDYVEGLPIDAYCETVRLPMHARLELFLSVCSAVHYAHQNLIVHRDLKPANILVTGDGRPTLLDFGIAKMPAESPGEQNTTPTLRWMTPEYSSPEQIRGAPVTTATDVYSLGVVLYRMLTGRSPHRSAESLEELMRVVSEEEPHPPGLSADLDNIIVMALSKEPRKRYSSVEQFSEDIRRYLEGLPVRARKQTWAYRTGKFLGRHKAPAFAAVLMVLLLAGGVASTQRQARVAERRFLELRGLAKAVLFEIHPAIESVPGSLLARQLLVKRGLEYLDRLAQDVQGDRQLQIELAAAYEKLGDAQGYGRTRSLADPEGALQSYRKSAALLDALLVKYPDSFDLRRDKARLLGRTADNLRGLGRLREAFKTAQERAALCEQLRAERPDDIDVAMYTAGAHIQMGALLGHMGFGHFGDLGSAQRNYSRSLEIHEFLAARHPGNERLQKARCRALSYVGDGLLAAGNTVGALEKYKGELAITESLARVGHADAETRRETFRAHFGIGAALLLSGDPNAALRSLRLGLAIAEEMARGDPHDAQARKDIAVFQIRLGQACLDKGKPAEALQTFRKSQAFFEALAASKPENPEVRRMLIVCHLWVGDALLDQGHLVQASTAYRTSLQIAQGLAARDSDNVDLAGNLMIAYGRAGDVLLRLGRPREALENYHEKLKLAGKLAAHDPLDFKFRLHRALVHGQIGRAHATLARLASLDEKSGRLLEARTWTQSGLDDLLALRKQGTWHGREARELSKMARDLTDLDKALTHVAAPARAALP